jgi:hypothetical protein
LYLQSWPCWGLDSMIGLNGKQSLRSSLTTITTRVDNYLLASSTHIAL